MVVGKGDVGPAIADRPFLLPCPEVLPCKGRRDRCSRVSVLSETRRRPALRDAIKNKRVNRREDVPRFMINQFELADPRSEATRAPGRLGNY